MIQAQTFPLVYKDHHQVISPAHDVQEFDEEGENEFFKKRLLTCGIIIILDVLAHAYHSTLGDGFRRIESWRLTHEDVSHLKYGGAA